MAKVLSRKCAYPCPILLDKPCELCQAETLFVEGYRKINENEIVISKEEYKHINSTYNLVRKKTAREIYRKGKELFGEDFDKTGLGEYIVANFLTQTKEFGVDLGEEK